MKKVKIFYKQATKFLKRHKSEILLGVSIGGTVAADVLFIYKGKKLYENNESPTAKNYISAYWLPIAVSAGSVVAGICSHNALAAEKMAMASFATYISTRYKNLQSISSQEDILKADEKTLEELRIEADAADELDDESEPNKELYYFPQYGLIFWTTEEQVRTAELNINEMFVHDGSASLGDFLYFLGIKDPSWKEVCDSIGWRYNFDDFEDSLQYISFTQYQKILPSGIQCNYVYFQTEAQSWSDWDKKYDSSIAGDFK